MRFLVDVNVSGSLVHLLKEKGHDVSEVRNRNPRMGDDEILDLALSELRIIVTTDKDFEEVIWLQGKRHCGILRIENALRSERKKLLAEALQRHGKDLESGAIVIALSKKFRLRRCPWSG